MVQELREGSSDGRMELCEVLEGVRGGVGGGRAGGGEHELLVEEKGKVKVEEDAVVEGQAQEDSDELELLGIVERVRVQPEEAGGGWEGREGGREGGRKDEEAVLHLDGAV